MKPAICKPIFVIGTGRSGTTLVMDMLAYHPDLAWFSSLTARFPSRPRLAVLHRVLDVPLIGLPLRRWLPRPVEAYTVWERCYWGFSAPFRDLTEADVTISAHQRITEVISQHLRYHNKPRFIAKYTGWPRVGFLNMIFPDALFIHVLRDGRAVVASHLERDFWRGWGGVENWRWGRLSSEMEAEWAASGYSFVVLAAIQWKMLMRRFAESRDIVGESRFLEIRYEDLVRSPVTTMELVLEFCELDNVARFRRHIRAVTAYDANKKWRQMLTLQQQSFLEASLRDALLALGYPVDGNHV